MKASVVVGADGMNGGLWCSPRREDVEADLFGLPGDGDGRLDALVLGGRPARGRVGGDVTDGEDPELHDPNLLCD
jgi:hypothetical protein